MKLEYYLNKIFMDRYTRTFIRHNKQAWSGRDPVKTDGIVLLYYYDIPMVSIGQSYFTNILARKYNAGIIAFSSTRRGFPWNLLYWKRDQVYRSFNTRGFIRTRLTAAQKLRAQEIFQRSAGSLKIKKDVYDMTVDGIWIGIDIYETYLRMYNKPTAEMSDPNLWKTIRQAIDILVFWQDYLKCNSVRAIVVSHDVYIYENILCKLGYQNNIPVYLPNVIGGCYAKKPFSVYDPLLKNYRALFAQLTPGEQQEGLKLAERQLQRRLDGEVGVDMPYSTKSAFNAQKRGRPVLKTSDKTKVLICSHCFYDNPHAYGKILFTDFYEWLCFLGRMSEKTDYDWYIKMHPDPLPGTEEIIRGIIAKFPKIIFLPPETSHHQLVAEGLNFVLTAYGSVGHELAALGIPVINAGYNPHWAYHFNRHPKSVEEYEHDVLNLPRLKQEIDKKEIHEFYYMHYYYTVADDLFLKSYREYAAKTRQSKGPDTAAYGYFLDHLTEEKHNEICRRLSDFIDSGKTYYLSRGPQTCEVAAE